MIVLQTTADGMRAWHKMWHAEQEIAEWERAWRFPFRVEFDRAVQEALNAERKNYVS